MVTMKPVLKTRRTLDEGVEVRIFVAACPNTGEVLESRSVATLVQSIARDLAQSPDNVWKITGAHLIEGFGAAEVRR